MVKQCSDSERLASLRLPLIIAVVYIHSYGGSYASDNINHAVNSQSWFFMYKYVTDLISQCLSRVAVPLFFLMSGFFLFLKLNLSFLSYKRCLHSRLSTLFIPYLFWNSFVLLLYWFFQSFTSYDHLFSADKIVRNYSFFNYADAFLGFNGYPIAYQFWFIRDLIVLVTMSPIILLVINSVYSSLLMFLIFVMWLSGGYFVVPSTESLFFFTVGGYCAVKLKTLFVFDDYVLSLGIVCAFLLLTYPLVNTETQYYFVKIFIIVGTCFILGVTRFLMYASRLKDFLIYLSSSSFFVFATHEPLLTLVKKLSASILPKPISAFYFLIMYLLVPLIVVLSLSVLYFALRRICPKLLVVISGR